jgi:hypothetical protein
VAGLQRGNGDRIRRAGRPYEKERRCARASSLAGGETGLGWQLTNLDAGAGRQGDPRLPVLSIRRQPIEPHWALLDAGGRIKVCRLFACTLPDSVVIGPHQTWPWMAVALEGDEKMGRGQTAQKIGRLRSLTFGGGAVRASPLIRSGSVAYSGMRPA